MARIRSVNTKPEMIVRRVAHSMGYRFRLHKKDLPGKPDLVFPSRKAAVFVHGCFWHQHSSLNCSDSTLPKSRTEYWIPKLRRNQERDLAYQRELADMGWKTLVIWDCETADQVCLEDRLRQFLGSKDKIEAAP